ncbi:MAG: hypothetical protein RLZZ262_1604 [Bacteroidota bacterium]
MRKLVVMLLAISALTTCKQSSPEEIAYMRQGDIIEFAGRKWDIKSNEFAVGPGPNYFSKRYSDVWTDEQGYLHLNIAFHDGKWYSTEVVSQDNLGYGKYAWTIQGDPHLFASNVVLGLFTWDNNTFFSQANSEVDIEFSYWGVETNTSPLTYSVQPVNFGPYYPERSRNMIMDATRFAGVTTHVFEWTPELITWYSYEGEYHEGATPYAQWSFDTNHPPRVKHEGGQSSQPIVIPAPGTTTNARMNFWTLPHIANGPANGLAHEVVIRDFVYEPM